MFAPTTWLAISLHEAVVDTHESYPKQTFRNRFTILSANGIQTLTLPVEGQKGQKIPTSQIKLCKGNWRKQHLAAIKSAYGRSAFFEHFYEDVVRIYETEQELLSEFALDTYALLHKFKLAGKVEMAEAPIPFIDQLPLDFRNCFEPAHRWPQLPSYPQVFGDRFGFFPALSGLDLLMNLGPRGVDYLLLIKKDCLEASKTSPGSSLL